MATSGDAPVRGWTGGWPRNQLPVLLVLAGVGALLAVASGLWPAYVPAGALLLLMMLAGYLLQLRCLLLLYAVLAPAVVATGLMRPEEDRLTVGVVAVLLLGASMVAWFVRTREVLGVQGNTGQQMLVDLRDRLRAQSLPGRLPEGVRMEVAQRSANGEGFSGDFVLSTLRQDVAPSSRERPADADWPGALEVAVVDVSGKGQAAGVRALLLSGGLSGLMAGTRSSEFLPAANAYLLRQEWVEGFATAVHLVLDPCTGDFVVRCAGHPPPVQHHAGSGSWQTLAGTAEPALGLMPYDHFEPVTGRLRPGDALVVYTDGVVEARERDLSYGVDRLVGQLVRHVRQGYRGAAAAGVDSPRGSDDDRTVVVVWRD